MSPEERAQIRALAEAINPANSFQLSAERAFHAAVSPEVVLALLDELERLSGQVVNLDRAYGEALLKAGGREAAEAEVARLKAGIADYNAIQDRISEANATEVEGQ